jgi:hypothetical protein
MWNGSQSPSENAAVGQVIKGTPHGYLNNATKDFSAGNAKIY